MNALIIPLLFTLPLLQDEGESASKVEVPSNLKPTQTVFLSYEFHSHLVIINV